MTERSILRLLPCIFLTLVSCSGGGGGGGGSDDPTGGSGPGAASFTIQDVQSMLGSLNAAGSFLEDETAPKTLALGAISSNSCVTETQQDVDGDLGIDQIDLTYNNCTQGNVTVKGTTQINTISASDDLSGLLTDCNPLPQSSTATPYFGFQANTNLVVTVNGDEADHTGQFQLVFMAAPKGSTESDSLAVQGDCVISGLLLENGAEVSLAAKTCFLLVDGNNSGTMDIDISDAGGKTLGKVEIQSVDASTHDFKVLDAAGAEVLTGSVSRD